MKKILKTKNFLTYLCLIGLIFAALGAISYLRIKTNFLDNQLVLLLAGLLVFFLAIILSCIFSYKQVKSLEEMTKIATQYRAGNFSNKIKLKDKNEYSKLGQNINELGSIIKKYKRKLSFTKNRLETILNNMASGLILVNENSAIILINPAAENIFQIKEEECLGKANLEVIKNYVFNETIEEVFQDLKPKKIELQLNYPEEKYLQAYFAPMKENKRNLVLIMLHDITAISQVQKIRTEFVANASHELRSPLTAIKGFAETLLDGALEDKELSHKFVSIIDQESERLKRVVEDLLDLSRIEAKKVTMQKNRVNINDLLLTIKSKVEPRLVKGGLELNIDIKTPAENITGDLDWIHQVFLNLIDNAIKYTQPGGKIFVQGLAEEEYNLYKISDTGIGIPKSDLSRIFERFYRVDKARSRQLGGTGLGLSIVKHIIESHDGKINVESIEGDGTTIWFTLPR